MAYIKITWSVLLELKISFFFLKHNSMIWFSISFLQIKALNKKKIQVIFTIQPKNKRRGKSKAIKQRETDELKKKSIPLDAARETQNVQIICTSYVIKLPKP